MFSTLLRYGRIQVRERLRGFGTVTCLTLLAEKLPHEQGAPVGTAQLQRRFCSFWSSVPHAWVVRPRTSVQK